MLSAKKKFGFTLIEILVVVTIIGVLASLGVVMLNSTREKAKDVRKIADIAQIRKALDLYNDDSNTYPEIITEGQPLAYNDNIYLQSVPGAPVSTVNCPSDDYEYKGFPATYSLKFCIGSQAAQLEAGYHVANDGGIVYIGKERSVVNYTLNYTAGAHGSLVGLTTQTVVSGSNGSAVEATPDSGYSFVKWSDDSIENPRTDINVTANLNISASFGVNIHTLNYTAGANGSIAGNTSQNVNHGESGTEVIAIPATGYHFVNWSDNGSTNATRTDTNITNNITTTANFAINTYTLTYTAGANGSISGTTSQTVNYGGSGTQVTAVANSGYSFVNWSDGSTTNPRSDHNISTSLNITANFAFSSGTLAYYAATLEDSTTITTQYATIPVEFYKVPNDIVYTATTSLGTTTADASMLMMRYEGNLTVNSGVTLIPAARKRGMVLYVKGNLNLNGVISMNARGAYNVAGQRLLIINANSIDYEIPATGGAGANYINCGVGGAIGGTGIGGSAGGTGGGGSGACNQGQAGGTTYSGRGSAGTSYSGGTGGGGVGTFSAYNGSSTSAGLTNGRAGGPAYYSATGSGGSSWAAGGGAGNNGGVGGGVGGATGGTGTGGLLIVIVDGNITIGSTGRIYANGSAGGNAAHSDGYARNAGGAGSGGGSINLFYGGTYINNGAITATGGAGGVASGAGQYGSNRNGGVGGAGSIRAINF